MRYVTITREKVKFVGCLVKYECYLNVNKEIFEQYIEQARKDEHSEDEEINAFFNSLNYISITNGKSVSIEIDEQQNELFVACGASVSNLQIIEAGNSDVSYSIKTNYSWRKGIRLTLYEN